MKKTNTNPLENEKRPAKLQLVEVETARDLDQKVLMEMERDADSVVAERLSNMTGVESVKLGKVVRID